MNTQIRDRYRSLQIHSSYLQFWNPKAFRNILLLFLYSLKQNNWQKQNQSELRPPLLQDREGVRPTPLQSRTFICVMFPSSSVGVWRVHLSLPSTPRLLGGLGTFLHMATLPLSVPAARRPTGKTKVTWVELKRDRTAASSLLWPPRLEHQPMGPPLSSSPASHQAGEFAGIYCSLARQCTCWVLLAPSSLVSLCLPWEQGLSAWSVLLPQC